MSGKKSDDTFIEGLKEASDTSVVLFIEDSVDKRSMILYLNSNLIRQQAKKK